jgi:hypothetical protein
MSEIAEAAAPAAEPVESAPSSTADIATSVLAELEGADAGTTAEAERGDADPAPGVVDPPPAPTQAEMSAAAKFLLAQGHKAKTTDGRDSWLKHSTVEKMLDRYVETHRGEWTGARGVIESELKEARGHLEQLRAGVSPASIRATGRFWSRRPPRLRLWRRVQGCLSPISHCLTVGAPTAWKACSS